MAGKSGAIKQGRAFIELFTDDSKLIRGLKKAEATVRDFGKKMSKGGKSLMLAATAITAPLAYSVRLFAKQGSELKDMSMRTGIAVESLSALEYVASQTGTTMQTLEKGVRLSQKAIGTLAGQKSLTEMGIDFAKLRTLSPEDQFIAIADYIGRIPVQADRAAAAMKIFGKGGADLLPLMDEGAGGVRNLMDEAARLGLVMSTSAADASDKFGDSMDGVGLQIKRLIGDVGGVLAPVIQQFAQKLSRIIPLISEWVKHHQGLIVLVAKSAAKILVFGAAMIAIGAAATFVVSVIGAIRILIPIIVAAAVALKPALMALVNPLVMLPMLVLAAYVAFRGGFKEIGRVFADVSKGMADALANGNIKLAAKILWSGLKILWAEGTRDIADMWTALATGGLKTEGFWMIYASMEVLTNGLKALWSEAITNIMGMWDGLTLGLSKGVAYVYGVFKGSDFRDEMIQGLKDEAAARAQDRIAPNQASKSAFDATMAQKRKAFDEMTAEADKNAAAAMLERIDKIQQLKAELADLNAKAKAEAAPKTSAVRRAMGAGAGDIQSGVQKQNSVQSSVSFDIGRSFGWNSGGITESAKTTQIAEQSLTQLKRIEENTADLGLAWE